MSQSLYGEFDPGSERTLAAWIRHASRTIPSNRDSGERVSNTWVICPRDGDNLAKAGLIPDSAIPPHEGMAKGSRKSSTRG
jgi:hypothetical protein